MNFPNFTIESQETISQLFIQHGIKDFYSACSYIQNLPYKRTSVKSNLVLVLKEKCGTCSSKHALLKKLAEENNCNDIELSIGIYKMNSQNTPGIKQSFPENIQFIPEAHVYLVFNKQRLDFTRTNSKPLNDNDILQEISVSVDELCSNKEQIHKLFISKWCKQNNLDFEKIWKIREGCIADLSA